MTRYAVLQLSLIDVSYALTLACIVYCIVAGIYRVYFHPLSRFPGPKVRAVRELIEGKSSNLTACGTHLLV